MSNAKPAPKRTRGLRRPVETDLGFDWGTPNTLILGLGLGALVVGYLVLSKGSTTLAPILLVLGYCVLIPASLLWRGRTEQSGE
jgi:membrane protein implicated in regulation of membrane protease activity